jgi:hypothetical protein
MTRHAPECLVSSPFYIGTMLRTPNGQRWTDMPIDRWPTALGIAISLHTAIGSRLVAAGGGARAVACCALRGTGRPSRARRSSMKGGRK